MEKHKRKKFDELFMNVANEHSKMSHAVRAKVGAVVTKDERIVSCGWNGTPTGFDNSCEITEYVGKNEQIESPAVMKKLDFTETDNGWVRLKTKPEVVHAEINALLFAARNGTPLEGSTLYTTCAPCIDCAKAIYQAGVKKVIYGHDYKDSSPLDFLKKCGIEVQKL